MEANSGEAMAMKSQSLRRVRSPTDGRAKRQDRCYAGKMALALSVVIEATTVAAGGAPFTHADWPAITAAPRRLEKESSAARESSRA
jgi:hypothetical protein